MEHNDPPEVLSTALDIRGAFGSGTAQLHHGLAAGAMIVNSKSAIDFLHILHKNSSTISF